MHNAWRNAWLRWHKCLYSGLDRQWSNLHHMDWLRNIEFTLYLYGHDKRCGLDHNGCRYYLCHPVIFCCGNSGSQRLLPVQRLADLHVHADHVRRWDGDRILYQHSMVGKWYVDLTLFVYELGHIYKW